MRFRRAITQQKETDENFHRLQSFLLLLHEDEKSSQGSGASENIASADTTTWHTYNPGTTGTDLSITGFIKRGGETQSALLYIWGWTHDIDLAPNNIDASVLATHANGTTYRSAVTTYVVDNANKQAYRGFSAVTAVTKAAGLPKGTYTVAAQWKFNTAGIYNFHTTTTDYGWLCVREVPMLKDNKPDSEAR